MAPSTTVPKQVMLSYHWNQKKVASKLKDQLSKRGFKVWIDYEQSDTSALLEGLARALEESEFVIILLSHAYQESNNCRAEAMYAHKLNKKIIYGIVESGYEPGGWLAIMMEDEKFFDLSKSFEKDSESLIKHVTDLASKPAGDEGGKQRVVEVPAKKASSKQVMISYCWEQQELALKLRDRLIERGFKVWIDVEKMEGSILKKMGEAVRDSEVIILLVSREYELSENCTTEAIYARKRKKQRVYALADATYKGGDWLDVMMGDDLYYNLAASFDREADNLVKRLNNILQ